MKYETLFIVVRVEVHADHTSTAEILKEVENESTVNMTDTANVNILETEILVSRVCNANAINYRP